MPTTAIESARDGTFRPNGVVSAVTAIASDVTRGKSPGGSIADLLIIVAGDALMGKTGARIQRNLRTTKVRVVAFATCDASVLTTRRRLLDISCRGGRRQILSNGDLPRRKTIDQRQQRLVPQRRDQIPSYHFHGQTFEAISWDESAAQKLTSQGQVEEQTGRHCCPRG